MDFRERIRVNGQMISEDYVVRFVAEQRPFFEPLQPSFFEVTTAMAFKYFEEQRVDIAVIEVGLGGRLDCTNIINPILSVITNISFDHTQFLGHTLAAIAAEKAGIIKAGVPVIVGETNAETKPVFLAKAEEVNAPIVFAEDNSEILSFEQDFAHATLLYTTRTMSELRGELCGYCQEKNTNTVLHALAALRQAGLHIEEPDVRRGFAHVCELTGLTGRWQRLSTSPTVICDTGHNEGGFAYIVRQLEAQPCHTMRIVFGMVSDKDVTTILAMLPKNAVYYFTQASVKRALSADDMRQKAALCGLSGHSYPTVSEAYNAALSDAEADDFVYVGGSSYVVADLLSFLFFKDK